MPAKRIEMRRIRDIMRLHEEGMSNRSIGLVVGVSPATVCDLLGRVVAAGLMWPLPDGLDDGQLEARLYPPDPSARGALVTPDWSYIHRELRRKHVTLMLLWQEYKADHPEDGCMAGSNSSGLVATVLLACMACLVFARRRRFGQK